MRPNRNQMNRREALRVVSGAVAGWGWTRWASAIEMPEVKIPRATDGDLVVEPDWEQRLVVTVGPHGADLAGESEKTIQAAVDYVARLGGGTVHIQAGTYRLRNAIVLASGVRLQGDGDKTILIKEPSAQTTIAEDSDWFDQEITLADATGFEVGDGICIQSDNPHHSGKVILKRTLVARSGNRFKLDRGLRENIWTMKAPTVSTLFPLVTAEEKMNLAIENLVIDGNREANAHLNGNYAGNLWFQDCNRILIRGVETRNNNGDGISWQICHDVVVEDCYVHGNADLGMHPGSGAQRPLIRNNRIERNTIGLFFCWGVQYGVAENNRMVDNSGQGLSIGHRDHYNIIRNNEITGSGQTGVLFRPERGEGFTATGNLLEENRIYDNGPENGAAVDFQGVTAGNTLVRNEIRETRGSAERVGIRIGEECGDNTFTDNRIDGFAVPMEDKRHA
ncbi:MAG: right-handed parallel beta-helix repeat-containing protein [Candidatus Hydrogenedentales bacterium]|jgi:nitrous oxidase accessory protein NosD